MYDKSDNFSCKKRDVSEICRSLKIMAEELNIPVIALSQLPRTVEESRGGRPRLADLRESGAIEQDADLVIMLYHPSLYKTDGIEAASPVSDTEVIIAKNRHGRMGDIMLRFFKEYTKFESVGSSTSR